MSSSRLQEILNKIEQTERFPRILKRMCCSFFCTRTSAIMATDVLHRQDEAYYFAPQGMTKIMNEGWASFWHSRIMTGGIR